MYNKSLLQHLLAQTAVCRAVSMQLSGIRLSVCPTWLLHAVGLQLWAHRAGDTNQLLQQQQQQQVNAGSAMLSVYVGSWTQTCLA